MRKLLAIALVLGCASPLCGYATLLIDEGFDNVPQLTANGWSLQNLSEPVGPTGWVQLSDTPFRAYDSGASVSASSLCVAINSAGTISNWLMTRVLDFASNSMLTFYTSTLRTSIWPDRLEVRLSTSGASTNAGNTSTTVGDFATTLLTINPDLVQEGIPGAYPGVWTQYTLGNLPHTGQGRVAFRYYVTDGGLVGHNSFQIGIDRVVYKSGFQVGGHVIGLGTRTGLALQLNGANDLAIASDGTFQFPRMLNGPYSVAVSSQPTGEPGACTVSDGDGVVADADVGDVIVQCAPPSAGTTWTIMTNAEAASLGTNDCLGTQCATLRGAINASASTDTIRFDPSLDGSTIALTLFDNDVSAGSTQFGPSAFFITGKKILTIDGVSGLTKGITIARSGAFATKPFRLFDIDTGSILSISGLALANGYAKGGDAVGSGRSGGGALGAGGAVFNRGGLIVDRCTFSGNSAQGGGAQISPAYTGNSNGGAGVGQDSPDGPACILGCWGIPGGGPNGGNGNTVGGNGNPWGFAPGNGGFGGGGGGNSSDGYGNDGGSTSNDGYGGDGGFGGGGGSSAGKGGGKGGFGAGGGGPGGFGAGSYGGGGAGMGGAIFNARGAVMIKNSTFHANAARGGSAGNPGGGLGGAVFNYDGWLDLDFVTAGNNVVSGANELTNGGAFYSYLDVPEIGMTLTRSIAAYSSNTSNPGNPLHDVVTAGNPAGSHSNNLIARANFGGVTATGPDPLVGYGPYGGPTWTYRPQVTSPAIDAAASCASIAIDQRGFARPQGMACDVGSVEVQPVEVSDVVFVSGFESP